MFCLGSQTYAQDTLYIYKGGAILYKRAINSVDSVGFTYIAPEPTTMTDNEGNIYHCKKIGTQTWMTENLRTTKYRNGETIENITDANDWKNATRSGWCYFNNDSANNTNNNFGKLYNWYAVVDSRNIAPPGWHVPSYEDFNTLKNYVSSNVGYSINVAKALASKSGGWFENKAPNFLQNDWIANVTNNLSINNSSGFSGVPAGFRDGNNGIFFYYFCFWWTTTIYEYAGYIDPYRPTSWFLYWANDYFSYLPGLKTDGYSVRLVKD